MGGNGREETRIKGVVEIPVSPNGLVALIDAKDEVWVRGFKWYAHPVGNTTYARTSFPRNLYMHVLMMGTGVDHKNGNGLDNRRENLRLATKSQNGQNSRSRKGSSSIFLGVSWDESRSLWKAQIKTPDGKQVCIGRFMTPETAALAYDRKARKYFGEFANLNFPFCKEEVEIANS